MVLQAMKFPELWEGEKVKRREQGYGRCEKVRASKTVMKKE